LSICVLNIIHNVIDDEVGNGETLFVVSTKHTLTNDCCFLFNSIQCGVHCKIHFSKENCSLNEWNKFNKYLKNKQNEERERE
jgi:hypothetical protein